MSAADKDPDKHSADADPPLTVELLADLQAGLPTCKQVCWTTQPPPASAAGSAQTRRLSKSCAR